LTTLLCQIYISGKKEMKLNAL